MINSLDYGDIKFPVSKKSYGRIEKKSSLGINFFGYKNGWVYPVHILDQKFEDFMDLLLVTDDNKSIMSILKTLTDLCVIRQNIRHGECNINLKLIKKIPVIFHNFRGCSSCLIMNEV